MKTKEFFGRIVELGERDTLPRKLRGTVRFDLKRGAETDHWYVALSDEGARVTHDIKDAMCVVRAEKELFDQLVTGQAHLVASLIRNELTVEGSLPLLLLFRRILPTVVGSRDPRQWRRTSGEEG